MNGKERTQIEALQKDVGELRSDISIVQGDVKWLKWVILVGFALLAVVVAIVG